MAVKARAEITISRIVDVEKIVRYYLLQSSTAATPSKPTANPPGGSWVTSEPAFSSGTTKTLYFVDLTVMTNGTYSYSAVSKSSSYEAAKEAWNKANNAQNTANDANNKIDLAEKTVETLSKLTNEIQHTADSNSARIESLNGTVANKADNSRVTSVEQRTSSVEQNLSGFKTEVSSTYTTKTDFNNLEIGGRNLIKDTSTAKVNTNWKENGWTGDFTTHDTGIYKICARSGWHVARYVDLKEYSGKTVTISFYGKCLSSESTSTDIWGLFISNNIGTNPYASFVFNNKPEKDTWNFYKYTCVLNNDGQIGIGAFCAPENKGLQTTWLIKNLKLEKGTKATDWTPAPEDLIADANLYAKDAALRAQDNARGYADGLVNDAQERINRTLYSELNKYVTTDTFSSAINATDKKISAKLESTTFKTFKENTFESFKKSTNEFIGTSEKWEMKWDKIFNSANAAEDTYQSYITFQNGEQILGNSKSNIKLHLKNDAIQFEDSNGNVSALFEPANIYLGKNSSESVIDLCNGLGRIYNTSPASGYKGLTIAGTDQTVIKSRYVVDINATADTEDDWYGSSIKVSTTDTPWYGNTEHGGDILLKCRGGNHTGTIYLTEGELMITIDDGTYTGFLQILNAENRVTLCGNQIHLAGKTYPEQGIFLPSNGTWWVGGKTATNCIVACQQTTANYHPAFRINSAGGHVWNIGGINNEIGFYGFKASRADNDNGVDFYTRWDMNNWDLIHSGYFEAHGLINSTSDYRSFRGGRDWRFGSASGTGDDNQFGFFDTIYGIHGTIVGSDHSLRMIGDIYAGRNMTGNEHTGIHLGGYKNGGQVFLYATMGTQNLWLQTMVNSNTSSASWAWYNVTAVLQKSSSDKRLKTNVRFSNVNALDDIDRMCVRSFDRIDEGGLHYSIGFIADELEEINQNLVSGGGYTEDGHPYYKSINGIYLTSYAIKGIQELHKKVREQKNEIDQQYSQLQSALGQIEALRDKLHELEMVM